MREGGRERGGKFSKARHKRELNMRICDRQEKQGRRVAFAASFKSDQGEGGAERTGR